MSALPKFIPSAITPPEVAERLCDQFYEESSPDYSREEADMGIADWIEKHQAEIEDVIDCDTPYRARLRKTLCGALRNTANDDRLIDLALCVIGCVRDAMDGRVSKDMEEGRV